MKSQQITNASVKETFNDLKTQLETVAKNHQASIQNLETKFDRLADKQSGRPSGSLPSNTQPNPKGHNSKTYQPPQSRNEHVNTVFTRSAVTGENKANKTASPIEANGDALVERPLDNFLTPAIHSLPTVNTSSDHSLGPLSHDKITICKGRGHDYDILSYMMEMYSQMLHGGHDGDGGGVDSYRFTHGSYSVWGLLRQGHPKTQFGWQESGQAAYPPGDPEGSLGFF
ncbi:hypothetical protein Tco_0977625 [Tanacetum coccineum]|uniref:Uncharacterized protein n=1 Tax=Tanacetum coccineum TaxID=301880 RepID=A0ABQ5EKL4_9ASTR